MLQSVLVISAAGLVVFVKHFGQGGVDRMVGALLRTISELAVATTGGSLAYLEFSTSAVYVAQHTDFPLYTAVFFDRAPAKAVGHEFGRVVASKLLAAFVDDYAGDLAGGAFGHVLGHFKGFAFRVPALVRDAARSVLQQFGGVTGLDAALLVGDDGLTESYLSPTAPSDLDDVALLSTLRPLLAACSDISACRWGHAAYCRAYCSPPSPPPLFPSSTSPTCSGHGRRHAVHLVHQDGPRRARAAVAARGRHAAVACAGDGG